MKKRIFAAIFSSALIFACVFCLAGCRVGIHGVTYYGSYADADKYSVGDFTYNAEDVRMVEINWVGGEIEIVQSENTTLSVTETSDKLDSDEQMHHYIRNNKLIIHYCESDHFGEISTSKKKIRVEIPEGIDLDIDNVSADVKLGTVKLSDLDLNNVSGDIEFAGITAGEIEIEIVSGTITAEKIHADDFSVKGVSGDIYVKAIFADEIDIEIVSGTTTIALEKACEAEVSGVSGDITVTLPEGIGAETEYKTLSGKLHSDITYSKNGRVYTFGDGEAKIKIETLSGDLYIK